MDKDLTGEYSQLVLGTLKDFPDTARLIGEFIVRWSLVEASLIMPMLVAINSPQQEVAAALLSSTNSTEGKIKLVKTAIAHMKHPQHQHTKAPINQALKTLLNLCEERNALCHHLWAVDVRKSVIVTLDYRKKKEAGLFTERSNSYLRDLCNRTVEAAVAICAATGSRWLTSETIEIYRL